ncbi:MAG: SAM-dependent methyltransferase [Deltaproteobacteria bacterium]|nr:SAM-dependent methyltransferase [Deltaproteobacteria bacterium]
MKDGKPSFTARVIALGRALYREAPADYAPTGDAIASDLLSPPMRAMSQLAAPLWSLSPSVARQLFRAATFGLSEHVALRTRAIDEQLADAISSGCTQVVTLGAGYDARPWRLACLEGTHCFEVDYPATQERKRSMIDSHRLIAGSIDFVPVDFAKDSLEDALASAGHDRDKPTAWILEGVTVYLQRDALQTLFANIAARSAPKSMLSVTYVPREVVSRWSGGQERIEAVMQSIGERFEGLLEPSALVAMLEAHAMSLVHDESTQELAARWMPAVSSQSVWNRERLALVRVR